MGGESQLDDGLDHILTLIKRGVKGLLHILKIKLMRSDGFYVNSTGGYRPDSCGKIVVIAVNGPNFTLLIHQIHKAVRSFAIDIADKDDDAAPPNQI